MEFLAGKVAIVTGGSRGIGRSVVCELAERGASVVFTHVRPIDAAIAEQEGRHANVMAIEADVRERGSAQQVVAAAIERFGGVDILVNNAGIVRDGLLGSLSSEDWDDVLETNLSGAFHYAKASIACMMRRGAGRVINIASVGAIRGTAGQTNYAASKAGLLGFTRSLAAEMAGFNITVNAVLPGFIDTNILDSMPAPVRAQLTRKIPARRLGTPREVAGLVGFLASRQADYITGQAIAIDGGLSN